MFEMTVEPRFAETDALGHIGNTTFPIWFEAARDPICRIFHPPMTLHDWPLILARLSIDFVAQTYLGAPVTVRTHIKRLGNSSCELVHEAWQKGAPVARATAVLVHFNYTTGRSAPIPDRVRAQLQEHLQEEPVAAAES
ncbi:acyl-CoA thioesterase [Exilibacterium tricleocarpae]|uniref:Acyl-CoA thioesterase n=1 Tax=Exilibacterium tricleocarpae TaxID=2591008 RepID=A0A545TM46_9GAMM|nr:thioesterase family protein [Exilibacterium tricleocarpae]TQV78256.1 acyl-CoA thioesterase [Exilibacterium tricleocarpae]